MKQPLTTFDRSLSDTERIAHLEQQVISLNSAKESLEKKVLDLSGENDELLEETQQAEQDSEELQITLASLTRERDRLEEDNELLRRDPRSATASFQAMEICLQGKTIAILKTMCAQPSPPTMADLQNAMRFSDAAADLREVLPIDAVTSEVNGQLVAAIEKLDIESVEGFVRRQVEEIKALLGYTPLSGS